MPPLVATTRATVSAQGPIVVLGDTQRTTWAETLLGREQNEQARRALIQKIASDERPAFVVHLGDMVEAGGSPENWQYFDRLMSPLTARSIPILPVIGNHDGWGDEAEARQQLRRRFPQLGAGGFYAKRHAELGLLWLDSNLEGAAAARQSAWLEQTLQTFEKDADVRGIVLFMHHPAYTNGKQRHGEPYVQQQVLPRFFAAKKTLALLSGHVHGYERFYARGRALVVSGGGGGPRVKYHVGAKAPYVPAYVTCTGARRAFNYVVMQPTARGLHFTVKCLSVAAACRRGELERFSVDFAAR